MNYYLSPNMNLVVPVPGVAPGPTWAQDLNASLTIVDAHNHSPGSGVQINPVGLNINADLTFQSNNATVLRSARFNPNSAPLSGSSDLGCIYESGVDLYYNDGAGNQIRITSGGSVAGASGTITGLPSGTASAAYQSASGTFQFQQATSTAANIDGGSLVIRYPGSYPSPTGNYILLTAPSSLSSGYQITLPALPGANSALVMNSSGVISTVPTGVTISSSCGAFSTSSTSAVPVTNLSVSLTSYGNPIWIGLIADGAFPSMVGSSIVSGSSAYTSAAIGLYQGSTQIGAYTIEQYVNGSYSALSIEVPSSSVFTIYPVSAGTYTFSVKMLVTNSSFIGYVYYAKLLAYELK